MQNTQDFYNRLNTHDWVPGKKKTAILLIDLQEYFRQISLSILDNIKHIISTAHEKDIPIFFTQHGHNPKEDTGMLGEWWADLIMEGSEEAQLLGELDVQPKDSIFAKDRYSAFYKTGLEKKLKEQQIKDLVIGGVMTNLCCETTARDAFVRDFRVFFLADGTATVSEDFHLATLKNLAYGFATILTCGQLVQWAEEW